MSEAGGRRRRLLVWDLPIRLFHWVAAALVLMLYLTSRWNRMDWHVRAGDALLALILFRLLWGLFGSDTARFARFVRSPSAVLRYLARLLRRGPDDQLGHNPAGGWMVVAMLALLLAQSLTGVFVLNDVVNEGPFTELVPAAVANAMTALHDRVLWDLLLAAIALHILAILGYALVKRHDLTRPMLTGRKWLRETTPRPRMARPALALLLLASAAGLAALIADRL
jgi:cytochrome b